MCAYVCFDIFIRKIRFVKKNYIQNPEVFFQFTKEDGLRFFPLKCI